MCIKLNRPYGWLPVLLLYGVGWLLCLAGCSKKPSLIAGKQVCIAYEAGKYTLYRNGKPYIIKGASGYAQLSTLKQIGGNTIRIYDTTHLLTILNDAKKNDIAVIVELPVADIGTNYTLYTDTAKIALQLATCTRLVNAYKNHPALLMWCLGNELTFPFKPRYNSFYHAFNGLVEMIHQTDPNHPVTTTMVNFQPKNIFNIRFRTNIDLISFNTFGRLAYLRNELSRYRWLWNGPYLITEWGINGPWLTEEPQTKWGAYCEPTSTKKAEQYLTRYQQYMPVEDGRYLGSFVFYWGQKQETTQTWFGMFDENGASSEAIGTMQNLFTGKWPIHKAPQLQYMLLNNQGAAESLVYLPNTPVTAQVLLAKQTNADSLLAVKWQIVPEDWYKKDNRINTKKLAPIEGLIPHNNQLTTTFNTPAKEGAYRIFAGVYDKHGNFATCNTPFYVVEK